MAELEQRPPKEPNFRLIGFLSIAVMLAIFLFCLLVLHWDGSKLIPRAHSPTGDPRSSIRLDERLYCT